MKNPKFWQVAEVQVTYKSRVPAADLPQISSSYDAENILRQNWSDDIDFIEEFVVLFLNRANKVKGLFRVSRGGTCGTVVDAKVVFAAAVKAMAAGIILAHNHPSGSLIPSQADLSLTKKLRAAGETLEVPVLDHIILAPFNGYYSFADEGTL